MFDIGAEVPVRLWKRKRYLTYKSMYEKVDKEDNTLGVAELYQGQMIVIEQQNTDGTWPKDITKKRRPRKR